MKKVILAVTVLGLAAAGMQTAKAGNFSIGVSIGVPMVYSAAVTYGAPAPQVVYPAPVYCPPPAPVVVYRSPVYCAPPIYCAPQPAVVYRAPAYYAPASICAAPAPVFSHRYGYGGEQHHYRHGRW